jgi:hypothetical protein
MVLTNGGNNGNNSQRHGNTAVTATASPRAALALPILHRACVLLPRALPPKENGISTDALGSTEPYRYGDSNPGFRTEKAGLP